MFSMESNNEEVTHAIDEPEKRSRKCCVLCKRRPGKIAPVHEESINANVQDDHSVDSENKKCLCFKRRTRNPQISPDDQNEPERPKRCCMNFLCCCCCRKSQAAIEENKAVEAKIQEHFVNEIQKKRHHFTDIAFLVLFLIFVLIQAILSLIIYIQGGDPRHLVNPHDSNGDMCLDPTPSLFYFNLADCVGLNALFLGCSSPTQCVASCPNNNLYYLIDSHRAILYAKYCMQSSLSAHYNGNPPKSAPSAADYLKLAVEQICPLYTMESRVFYGRCLPTLFVSAVNSAADVVATDPVSNLTLNIHDLTQPLNYNLISQGAAYVTKLLAVKETGENNFIFMYIIKSLLRSCLG
jgi:hypothetical protein